MKKILVAICASLTLITSAHSEGTSWIASDFPTLSLSDTEQAQQWALCAATLEVLATVTREQLKKPATADKLDSFSSGAKTAIMGVFAMKMMERIEGKTDAEVQDIFRKTFEYAAMASDAYPDLKKTEIMSDLELRKDKATWYADLGESAKSCLQKPVLEIQQAHIDMMREIASGVGGK